MRGTSCVSESGVATESKPATRAPVSVVIPVRNEEHSIRLLLVSLLAQEATPDEIIVVDGGSLDETVSAAREFSGRGVRVLEVGPALPGRGRNCGILAARHDWVALIDGGCMAEPGWLAALLCAANDARDVGMVLGNYEPLLETEWDVAQALATVPPPDPSDGCRPPFIASSLVRKASWEIAGAFPEHLRAAEDLLFVERLQAAGVRIARAPGAMISWRLAPGPLAFFRRLRLYSAHHMAAKPNATWHLRVFMMDAVGVALVLAAFRWWPSLLLLGAAFGARVFKTVLNRRANIGGRQPYYPSRLCRVAFLLLLADAAAWMGSIDHLFGRARRTREARPRTRRDPDGNL